MPSHSPILALTLIACVACSTPRDSTDTPPLSREDPAIVEKRKEILRNRAVMKAPPTPVYTRGEVPDAMMKRVRDDLAERLGHGNIKVWSAQAVVWNSGAMGCPRPGMTYPQVVMNGYHVIFTADGKTWDYRMNEGGRFVLCEKPGKLEPAPQPIE